MEHIYVFFKFSFFSGELKKKKDHENSVDKNRPTVTEIKQTTKLQTLEISLSFEVTIRCPVYFIFF
jgi:hypothetical protein